MTVLPVSIVTWSAKGGREGYVLIRRGVMTLKAGDTVEIAARGGYRDDELQKLGMTVLDELRRTEETEDVHRTSDTRLHLATMRQIEKVLRAERGTETVPPRLSARADVMGRAD